MISAAILAVSLIHATAQTPPPQNGTHVSFPEVTNAVLDPGCANTPALAASAVCYGLDARNIDAVVNQFVDSFRAQGLQTTNTDGPIILHRPGHTSECGVLSLSVFASNTPDAEGRSRGLIAIRPVAVCDAEALARSAAAAAATAPASPAPTGLVSSDGRPLIGIPRLEGVQRDHTCGGLAADQIGPTDYCATVSQDRADDVFAAYATGLESQNLDVRQQGEALVFSQRWNGSSCDAMRLYRRPPVSATVTIVIEGLTGPACSTYP